MKKTIAILFIASALSSGAADFDWSWEKGGAAPSERPQSANDIKPVEAQPVAGPAEQGQNAVDTMPSPVQPAVNSAGEGSPAAPSPSGDDFLWNWEKDAAKTGSVSDIKKSDVQPAVRQAEEDSLPAEIENMSGAVPKASIPVAPRRPNPPSSPVVVSRVAEQAVPVEEVKSQPDSVPAKMDAGLPVPGQAAAGGIDVKAYDELIRENLDLHKKIAQSKQDKDLISVENQKLAREIKDLEQKISESVGRIKDLGKQKESSSGSPVELKILEDRLAKTEQEKSLLGSQLAALQKKIEEQPRLQPAKPLEPAASRTTESVKAGSDLYKRLESENLVLRQKLAEIDAERQKAVKSREETEKRERLAAEDAKRAVEGQKLMKTELEAARTTEKKQKRVLVDLAERIPGMEKEMGILQKKLSEKDAVLKEKEKNLEVLANEIQQRENRIRKAEKMVELMDQAQKDVSQVSDTEKRDMHYNMAAVYSQTGRYSDAEREYLHALRLDPTDADVHYNLGILYDENLKEKQKAAMHYRRYLKLRPSGPDVDAVKNWLLNIDMKK